MSTIDDGDTVEYVHEQLGKLIADGRGKDTLWIDLGAADEPASLYCGANESDDVIGEVGINQ